MSASAEVLVLSTVITSARAPLHLQSVYVGTVACGTAVTHLLQGPGSDEPDLQQRHRDHRELPVGVDNRRLCLYDHLQVFLTGLRSAGHDATIDVSEGAAVVVDD